MAQTVVMVTNETNKAIEVSAPVYRDGRAVDVTVWLPLSQIKVSEIPGRGTKEFDASVHTTLIEMPAWLFAKVQKETRASWHDVSEAAKSARLAELDG